MRIVGMAQPDSTRWLYSSIPVIPGILTSAIKQAVSRTLGDSKKSIADRNASAVIPSDLIRALIASRKSSSSSITEISVLVGKPDLLVR